MDGALAMDVDDSDGVAGGAHDSGALIQILMDDEELDAMAELAETPVAAQISHSQIIEKQAHSIAKLEKHAERAKEYKTLTKVKLKEAALRLREYRLKVEALMAEVEALKKVQQANEKKIKTMEKKNSVIETPIEEEPAAAGRGKGGRGRGRGGRGGRGRGRGAAAVSEPVASGENEQKAPSVETKCIGTQAEDVKSFADAATQTMEADRVETADFGVQTQAKEKSIDSGVQTTISGEIQVATAPVRSVSAGIQTEETAVMESGCQCDLLPPGENSADRIEDEQSSQVSSSSKRVGSRSRSADWNDMGSAISYKRKRSFESTTGRGGKQPIPSALVASVSNNEVLKRSDSGVDAAVLAVGVNTMHVDGEADGSMQTGEINVIEERIGMATEVQRAREQEESKLAPLQSVAFDEGISTVTTAKPDTAMLPPDHVNALDVTPRAEKPVESPQSRVPINTSAARAQNSPAKQFARVEPSALDAIGAAIDAELDFSDSDEEEVNDKVLKSASAVASQLERDELTTSEVALQATVAMPGHLMENDAISSAIDDELMTSDDDEDQNQASQLTAASRPSAVSVSNDAIGVAIDEDLADSSDDEDHEKLAEEDGRLAIPVIAAAVSAAIDDELASSSDEEIDERGVPETAMSMSAVAIDPISAAIDDELASSSDEETEPEAKPVSAENDPIGDAIDDELMSSSDEEDVEKHRASQLDVKGFSLTSDPFSAAIDDELASNSDEEDAEVDASQVSERSALEEKDFVASAIDEELASSSDEDIDRYTPVITAAATSEENDPIGASIDDELASSSEHEDLGNQTDEPSPTSTLETVDLANTADESASRLDEENLGNQGEEASEAKQEAGASLLMSMLSRRPEKKAASLAAVASSSKEKDLVGASIDDELASRSDEEEPEKPASDVGAAVQVTKKSKLVEAKSAPSHVGEATGSSSSALPSSESAASSSKEAGSSAATANTPVSARLEVRSSLSRSPQTRGRMKPVKREEFESEAVAAKKDDESRSRESTPASRDPLAAVGNPSLSLSSSSSSSDSDSSDSGTDSDDEQSAGDVGLEYEPEVVDVDASMEEELSSTAVQGNSAGAQPVQDSISVFGEKQLTRSPVRLQKLHSDCTEVAEKALPEKEPTTLDTDKQDPPAALSEQLDAKSESALSDDEEEGEIQTSPKKRRRTFSSDTTESQASQHMNKSSATESSPVKRLKLHLAQTPDATASKRGFIVTAEAATVSSNETPFSVPPPAPVQPKRDPFAKPLASFQRSIEVKGKKKESEEEMDPAFVARTLLLLLKTSALRAISKPILVNKLCDVLTAYYREKEISPMLLVQETCRMLQLPKVRQMMEKGGLSACFVAHQVLLRLVGVPTSGQEEEETEVHLVPEAEKNQLAQCIQYLRSLLLVGRDHLARDANLLTLSDVSRSQQFQWTRLPKTPASHDKVFLAHVCSFYARICKSIGFEEAINVLVFDLLRWNPSIKGLFFTRAIVDVAPKALRTEFGARGHQLPAQLIKSTIHHVLAVIDALSTHKQERVLGFSSRQLMHHIAEHIQDESLLHVNAEASAYRESSAAKLWDEYIVLLAKQGRCDNFHSKDVVFEVCKSLELLTAVYMQWQMMELFPAARFQELFEAGEHPKGRTAVVKMVGAIAVAFAAANRMKRLKSKAAEAENSSAAVTNAKYDSSSGDYVLRVCDWLQQLLTQEASTADIAGQLEVQLASASVCVELISESAATRERRHKMLRDVLQWFKRQPQEQQMRFPGAFLRQLRLLTLSTRPIVKTS